MAIKTKTELLAAAATIKNETAQGANTAQRVGEMLENIIDSALRAKIYRALITQTGTSAPTVTVLENTLGGAINWTRSNAGNYYGELTGGFPAGKTFIPGNTNAEDGSAYSYNPIGSGGNITGYWSLAVDSEDFLLFQTISASTNNAVEYSSLLANTTIPIEIIIYP